jgi:glycine cleavage system H protein
MENGFRQVTVGKFVFRVKVGYLYTDEGLWLAPQASAGTVRVGLSDYRQQSSGDVAFVDLPAVGQNLRSGDDLASVETVKVDMTVAAPFAAEVIAVNTRLADTPELINQDPYGAGWLVELKPAVWPAPDLLAADVYLAVMTAQAEEASR